MEYSKDRNYQSLAKWLVQFILFLTVLTPSIKVNSGLPAIRLEDLLFPIAILVILRIGWFYTHFYFTALLLFLSEILLSMIINGRLLVVSDYFELFKLVKFIIYIVLVYQSGYKFDDKFLKRLFLALVVFNCFQFFNIFSFNTIIEPFFAAENKVDNFEKNARLLGTLGNPNNNSILFIFFFSLFFRKDQMVSKTNIFFLALATVLIFMCLSRTSLAAFLISVVISILLVRPSKVLVFSMASVFVLIFAILMSTSNYVTNAFTTNVLQNTSLLYRVAIWYKLILMILDKPLLGHAPYKEFFYNNHLFAESEFILTTWRYGFIGLFLYLFQLVGLAISSIRRVQYNPVLMMGICVFIAAFTNNPLNHNTINLLFAACVGLFFIDQNSEKLVQ